MNQRLFASCFFFLFLITPGFAPAQVDDPNPLIISIMDQVDQDRIADNAKVLIGQVAYDGEPIISRHATHPDHLRALAYLESVMDQYDYPLVTEPFSCNSPYTCENLVLEIPGAADPDKIWVIGAHLDSTQTGDHEIDPAPGAVDNASGVIVVLEVLHLLSQYEFDQTIRFILFDNEERSPMGSMYHAEDSLDRGDDIQVVANLDLPGWRIPFVNAALSSCDVPSWPYLQRLNQIGRIYESGTTHIGVIWADNDSSNHASFWNEGYASFILGSAYDITGWMHTDDTYDKLDLEQCANVARLMVAYLCDRAGLLPYTDDDDDVTDDDSGDDDDFVDDDDDFSDDDNEPVDTGADDDDDDDSCCG